MTRVTDPRPSLSEAALLMVLAAGTAVVTPLYSQQDLGRGEVTSAGPAEYHTRRNPDVPPPPRALAPLREHGPLRVPAGHSKLARPDNPPGSAATAEPDAPGDLRFWENRDVVPSGAMVSATAPEPAACINQDTALITGNWWAGLSLDSGRTFTTLNPATFFPAIDGGFCCDQRCIYSPEHDITIWYLQYGYSATTARGSVRIAVAVGRDGLRNGQWHSWVWSPQNFNQAARTWLDFPDVALTDDYLFATANVFSASSVNLNSVVWRMSLANLRAGGNLSATYFTRNLPGSPSTLGGIGSYRFTQGSGPIMYFATHVDRATMNLYRWPDGGGLSSYSRSVPVWEDGVRQAPSPNNSNWMANLDSRILGGYRNALEIGFLWSCEEIPPFRPWPYLRVERFSTLDLGSIEHVDVWNLQYGIGYPGCTTNARGDQAVVMAIGGPNQHVRSAVFLVDQYQPSFAGQSWAFVNAPTLSPTGNRWGDYFTCARHPKLTNTFVGTAAYASGSSSTSRYLWFSREADEPSWADLHVGSVPISGVPITIDVLDRNGNGNGTTGFVRTFAPHQGYTLTAPYVHIVGLQVYVFERWSGTFSSNERVLVVPDMQTVGNLETAQYVLGRKLRLFTNVSSTVTVAAVPDDVFGVAGGNVNGSGLELTYVPGTRVRLTAPSSAGGNAFKHWLVPGSTPVPNRVLDVVVSGDLDLTAEYFVRSPGSFTSFGQGCPGSSQRRGVHGARGSPEIGSTVRYDLRDAPPSAPCWFVLGTSDRSLLGLPLPFDLAPLGAPACFVYCSQELQLGGSTDAAGSAQQVVQYPDDPVLVGQHVFSQFLVLDPPANRLGLATTNGVDTAIGGVQ